MLPVMVKKIFNGEWETLKVRYIRGSEQAHIG